MEHNQGGERGEMNTKFRFRFTAPTDVGFINPDTMRKEWYQCYYDKGSTLEVVDLLSGNHNHIFAFCTDGVIVFVDTMAVKVESIQ
jgi:hypothetical protein